MRFITGGLVAAAAVAAAPAGGAAQQIQLCTPSGLDQCVAVSFTISSAAGGTQTIVSVNGIFGPGLSRLDSIIIGIAGQWWSASGIFDPASPFTRTAFIPTAFGSFTADDVEFVQWTGLDQSGAFIGCTNADATTQGLFTSLPDCTPTVIPEPFTVTLLASGLMGLAGVGAARRRRPRDGES